METPAAPAEYCERGFDSKETPMNADTSAIWMTLTSLQIINLGESGPAYQKWSFTVGALGGTTLAAIGFLVYRFF
jgi:hypothetical protein